MSTTELSRAQFEMADFLRNPDVSPAPANLEPRRLKIYQDLIYNNIEGFISGGFPVLRSLYDDAQWRDLVRLFIDGHRCHTPYFLEISQEFLRFLTEEYQLEEAAYPFIAELAHYEWVELALDVSEESLDSVTPINDVMRQVSTLSPLAWLLSYQFPVHQIGASFTPTEAGDPTFLVVYRDRGDDIRFMALNPATARLLELLRDNTAASGQQLLQQLSAELQLPLESVTSFGSEMLTQMAEKSVIICA